MYDHFSDFESVPIPQPYGMLSSLNATLPFPLHALLYLLHFFTIPIFLFH